MRVAPRQGSADSGPTVRYPILLMRCHNSIPIGVTHADHLIVPIVPPDNCVSGFDNKAYCGYGEYTENSKCPLNVCCSKSVASLSLICERPPLTAVILQLDGDTAVSPASSAATQKLKRPSTEYNGFTPLRRIVGYYEGRSHERPCNTFYPEQIPPGIYTHLNYAFATIDPVTFEVKLASTKEEDLIPRLTQLKTQDADLKRFFRSLISFLSTYNLDGVDIDWEYPRPHDIVDRGGRDEDFENFPIFLRRLKQALRSAGGRYGVTLTLPASYWFLQYFDIVNLEKHVDFFNIMSYDLHGAWDKGNKWLGPYLNAHTNLTEIGTVLDLLWWNKIPSNKVVLGTAFYGRAFTATSSRCMEPGCTFESAGTMGSCSRENGILLNSEIMDILDARGVKPTLDKIAGVKIATWDNQWVADDDKETLELKAQFSLGLGLGGVMVWAVSHDTQDQRFSNSFFRRAANGNGMTNTGKWTNCGQTCPPGYQPALRTNPNAKEDELMLDTTAWDGNLHTLCCPESSMATCGWYIHTNSFCDYTCPRDFVEVGSTDGGCHGGYQAACCRMTQNPTHSWSLTSMELWGQCEWTGDRAADRLDPQCGVICPPMKRLPEVQSTDGSGAVSCDDKTARLFCCRDGEAARGNHWLSGEWEGYEWTDRDRCSSDCDDDMYRLGMQQSGPCENKPGAMAFCAANGHYDIEYEGRGNATKLKDAPGCLNNPQCPNDQSGGLSRRATTVSEAHTNRWTSYYREIRNEVVSEHGLENLQFPGLMDTLREMYDNIYENLSAVKDQIMCYFEDLNDLATTLTSEDTDPCDDEDSERESEEWDDPCPDGDDESSQEKRGQVRRYCVKSRARTLRSRQNHSTGQIESTRVIRTRVVVLQNR
ncbi:hypothetical protein BDW68DRAFT_178697 [Aspergillus falconensis]